MRGRNINTDTDANVKQFAIAEKLFKNKTSASAWLSKLLKTYSCGSFLDGRDKSLLLQLLNLADSQNPIIKKAYLTQDSPLSFKVDRYSLSNGKRIVMLFVCNGINCQPLSKSKIIGAIWPAAYNHLAAVKGAARLAIDSQIQAFRASITLPVWCPISNKKLTNWKQIHIDHVKPFSILLEEWLDLYSINPNEIKLKGYSNSKLFADQSLLKSWTDYHQTHAVLQAVYSKANLSKGAKVQ